jgi:hypothetical protein
MDEIIFSLLPFLFFIFLFVDKNLHSVDSIFGILGYKLSLVSEFKRTSFDRIHKTYVNHEAIIYFDIQPSSITCD